MHSILVDLQRYGEEFYRKKKTRIICILLGGSLGRNEATPENLAAIDADINVITRFYYDLLIQRQLRRFLEVKIPGIAFDVGVYSLSRLKSGKDRSQNLFDLKYNSKILAGKDVRSEIPGISVQDFYPFEAFRLIFNRTFDLIKAVRQCNGGEVEVDTALFRIAKRRVIRAHIDSYLIFNKKYSRDYEERERMFLAENRIPAIENFDDARQTLLKSMSKGLETTRIPSSDALLEIMSQRYAYPIAFRIYTAFQTKKLSAFFSNPVFRVYHEAMKFLESEKVTPTTPRELAELVRIFESCPQPVVLRAAES